TRVCRDAQSSARAPHTNLNVHAVTITADARLRGIASIRPPRHTVEEVTRDPARRFGGQFLNDVLALLCKRLADGRLSQVQQSCQRRNLIVGVIDVDTILVNRTHVLSLKFAQYSIATITD